MPGRSQGSYGCSLHPALAPARRAVLWLRFPARWPFGIHRVLLIQIFTATKRVAPFARRRTSPVAPLHSVTGGITRRSATASGGSSVNPTRLSIDSCPRQRYWIWSKQRANRKRDRRHRRTPGGSLRAATMMSHSMASSLPPPSAYPSTALQLGAFSGRPTDTRTTGVGNGHVQSAFGFSHFNRHHFHPYSNQQGQVGLVERLSSIRLMSRNGGYVSCFRVAPRLGAQPPNCGGGVGTLGPGAILELRQD
jgi:hypothetical protein